LNFTSLAFLIFFPVVALLHWLLPHRFRWVLLLAASWCFYLWWDVGAGVLLALTTLASWGAALRLERRDGGVRRGLCLALGAGVPLLCLLVFKYAGFFARTGAGVLRLLGLPASGPRWTLPLPPGISFYTFQTLSYVLDVWRGERAPEKHLGYYALYVSFFPQLVAGPIERPGRLLPQLRSERGKSASDLRWGLWRILRGFFKKLVVADALAGFADPVFDAPDAASGPAVLLAAAFFAVQIYCDFSGYSDIALGTARVLGVRLMENFDGPYRAENIRDFWRRWHISLTSWFTDYLYKPLGGSRRGLGRQCRNIMLVFLASGLWHGAGWSFVVWGGLHGLYLVCHTLGSRLPFHPLRGIPGRAGVLARRGWVFALACLAWVFFRAGSVAQALELLARLGCGWGPGALDAMGLDALAGVRVLLSLVCLRLFSRLDLARLRPGGTAAREALGVFYTVLLTAVSWLALLAVNGNNVFLYFQL